MTRRELFAAPLALVGLAAPVAAGQTVRLGPVVAGFNVEIGDPAKFAAALRAAIRARLDVPLGTLRE